MDSLDHLACAMYISYILQRYFLIVFYPQRIFHFYYLLPAFLVFQVLFSSISILWLHPYHYVLVVISYMAVFFLFAF